MNIILNVLYEITIYSAALTAAILLFKKIFRKHISAAMNYAVWGILILRLLMPVTLDSGFHLFVIRETPVQAGQAVAPSSGLDVQEQTGYTSEKSTDISSGALTGSTGNVSIKPEQTEVWKLDWQTALVIIWGSGVLCSLIYVVLCRRRLYRKIIRYGSQPPMPVINLISRYKKDLGIKANIRATVQDWLKSPALTASFRPNLLIPQQIINSDEKHIEFGIRHEFMHYRRMDHLANMLLIVLRCFYWFNPLVYFAFRNIQADMETACDAAVASGMGNRERTQYIKTMIDMGGRDNIQHALGMGVCRGRKAMERRVRGIFMKKRSGCGVKIAAAILAGILLMTCFTTACQPTPEKPSVTNITDNLSEKQPELTPAASQESYQAPNSWQDTLTGNEGKLIIRVNADIDVPPVSAIPVYKIAPKGFTKDQAENMMRLLFRDAKVEVNSQRWTKSQYEALIARFKKAYADGDEPGMTEDNYKANLEDLEQRLKNAPDTVEKMDISAALKSFPDTNRIDLMADMGRAQPAKLTIVNADEGYKSRAFFSNNDGKSYAAFSTDKADTGFKIIKEEAVEKAKALVADLGVDYMDVAGADIGAAYNEGDDIKNSPKCYLIYFTRTVGGVPTTYDYRTGDSSNSDTTERTWAYERITVGVDDSGIVQFEWEGCASLGELTAPGARLLTFENIQGAFKQAMEAKYANAADSTATTEFDIDRIILGMSRIKVKGSDDYCLVPVWDFFGTLKDGTGKADPGSVLTLNALDGSVIDRDLGY